jgi:hypothetical protein
VLITHELSLKGKFSLGIHIGLLAQALLGIDIYTSFMKNTNNQELLILSPLLLERVWVMPTGM